MAPIRSGQLVPVASAADVPAIAELRALWSGAPCDAAFRRDVAEWLEAVTATADERGHARVVVSPAERALPLYRRAGS